MNNLWQQYLHSRLHAMSHSQYGLMSAPKVFPVAHKLQSKSAFFSKIPTQHFWGGFEDSMLGLGVSDDPSSALLKCYFECIERYSMAIDKPNPILISKSYNSVIKKYYTTSPLLYPTYVNASKLSSNLNWQAYQTHTVADWIKVEHAWSNQKSILPIGIFQVNGLNNQASKPILAFPSSNGCAFHFDWNSAKLSALCELVERHQFLLYWRTFNPGREITIDSNLLDLIPDLKLLEKNFLSKIKLHSLDFESQWPVVVASFWGDGESSPSLALSGSSHNDPRICIKKAISELLMCLAGLEFEHHKIQDRYDALHADDPDKTVISYGDRTFYYYKKKQIRHLGFWRNFSKTINFSSWVSTFEVAKDSISALQMLIKIFYNLKMDAYFYQMKNQTNDQLNGFVARAVVPEFMPMDYFHMARVDISPRFKNSMNSVYNHLPHPFP